MSIVTITLAIIRWLVGLILNPASIGNIARR